jgi:hypothetical protein
MIKQPPIQDLPIQDFLDRFHDLVDRYLYKMATEQTLAHMKHEIDNLLKEYNETIKFDLVLDESRNLTLYPWRKFDFENLQRLGLIPQDAVFIPVIQTCVEEKLKQFYKIFGK